MSESNGVPVPDDEEEYRERQRELIEETREAKQELEAQQQAALEAISEGGDIEEYATVKLGELDVDVLAWLPGEVEDTVLKAQSLADSDDPDAIRKSKDTLISALTDMTVREDLNRKFWQSYHAKYGLQGLMVAADTVFEPAMQNVEERKDAVDGFRPDGQSAQPGAGMRDAGDNPE